MPTRTDLSRRLWLRHAAHASALLALGPTARLSLAAAPASASPRRLVVVILRGGLDGLAALPPVGDAALTEARAALVPAQALPLTALFALHPAMPQLHALFGQREALMLHAVGLPYQDRSHFDAQQVLESGGSRPFELATGWLGRALAGSSHTGMAFQSAVPLMLRGHAGIDTWAPSSQPEPANDLVDRLQRLYAQDAPLAAALNRARALRLDGMPVMDDGMAAGTGAKGAPRPAAAIALARQAAGFLAKPQGPQAAVLEMGGWDTHANQGAEAGPLAANLGRLDAVLGALRAGLTTPEAGDTWRHTAVLVVTEFGRTVMPNGTQGTDHGTGSAAWLVGGAVAGGQVLADWPGLATAQRNQGRDLRATTDLRAVFKTLLHHHLQQPLARVHDSLLPGSAGLPLLPLLRA